VTEFGRQHRCSYLHFVKYINPSVPASVHRTDKNAFKGIIPSLFWAVGLFGVETSVLLWG